MGKWFFGILAVVALVAWWQPRHPTPQSLTLVDGDDGAGEERVGAPCSAAQCLIVYVAPWCPSCRAAAPMIRDLRATLVHDGVPVSVVVGMDAAPALERYGRALGYPALLDTTAGLQHSIGVPVVPYFVVIDAHGAISRSVRGASDGVPSMRERLAL